jgi:hypothetical protein
VQHCTAISEPLAKSAQFGDGSPAGHDAHVTSAIQSFDGIKSHTSAVQEAGQSRFDANGIPSVQQHLNLSVPQGMIGLLTTVAPVATPSTITITAATYLPSSACSSICQTNAVRPALKARQADGYEHDYSDCNTTYLHSHVHLKLERLDRLEVWL